MARDRRGLIRTTSGALEAVIGETATTLIATTKAIGHGANAMEVTMRESVVTSIEDFAVSRIEAKNNLVKLGMTAEEVEAMFQEYKC